MSGFLILIAVIIFTCVFLNNVSNRLGVPVLLCFILLGIVFGWNKTVFDVNQYHIVEDICSIALIFIMFYGGFGTGWKSARPVMRESVLLATMGVAATAGLTGLFCHLALGWSWLEALLMGSVVSSTDAASVFSILRSKRLGLKNNTAPMLEIESGSNDPMSYMLTAIMLSIMRGTASGAHVLWMVVAQILFGVLGGIIIAKAAALVLKRFRFATAGFDSLFIFATAILAYALPQLVGGNGYLSTYIVGIILGNTNFRGRKVQVHFFDGVTSLMQVLIFFLLGLMADPMSLHKAVLPALAIFLFMMLVSRPVSVISILSPFGKYSLRQQLLVSFVGLRGAASIVFAIMAISGGVAMQHDLFNIVFCIVLISIALQGSLIPKVSTALDMIDSDENVLKTFNDYSDDMDMAFSSITVTAESSWNGRLVRDLGLPHNVLLVLILHKGERVVPHGDTVIQQNDTVITCTQAYDSVSEATLYEHPLSKNSRWAGHRVNEYPYQEEKLIVLIRRGDQSIIPRGDTVFENGDVLVIMNRIQTANQEDNTAKQHHADRIASLVVHSLREYRNDFRHWLQQLKKERNE